MTDPADLPVFSGRDVCCPKCNRRSPDSTYSPLVPDIVQGYGGAQVLSVQRRGPACECLVRACPECGWTWLERCADAPAGAAGGRARFADPARPTARLADGTD